jgi:hypothetical protein
MVNPYALLLFGGKLKVHHKEGLLSVGEAEWIQFYADPRIGVLVKGLRTALSKLLARKVSHPAEDISASPIIEAILKLLVPNWL